MQTVQAVLKNITKTDDELSGLIAIKPHLVLVFAAPAFFEQPDFGTAITDSFPDACIIGCSTAGEISTDGVYRNSCIVTATRFDHTSVIAASTVLNDMSDSHAAGLRLAELLQNRELCAVMLFGPGIGINGSALIKGIAEVLGDAIPVTGGLAGDDDTFTRTWTFGPDGVSDRAVVAVGLLGSRLQFSHGSFGGWKAFGPSRRVTRCENNILYELDGEPALPVYKSFLGNFAKGLPATGLLFPFAMFGEEHDSDSLIRTILGVNEADDSLVLAGEIKQGGFLKLMHASTDSLINGAETAARSTAQMQGSMVTAGQGLAVLVSCVGRKLVMGERVGDEIAAVSAVLGYETTLAGYYSFGEICPFAPGSGCELHNQTMTITHLVET